MLSFRYCEGLQPSIPVSGTPSTALSEAVSDDGDLQPTLMGSASSVTGASGSARGLLPAGNLARFLEERKQALATAQSSAAKRKKCDSEGDEAPRARFRRMDTMVAAKHMRGGADPKPKRDAQHKFLGNAREHPLTEQQNTYLSVAPAEPRCEKKNFFVQMLGGVKCS